VVLNEESFEDVHELADISRPVVAAEFAQECFANRWDTNSEPGGELPKEELNQTGNIFSSNSKRRHFDANDVQSKKEISPETPSIHIGFQIAVRRSDNSS
jgi:hypothetical protein